MSLDRQRLHQLKLENIRLETENIKLTKLVNEFMAMILQNPDLRAEIDRINKANVLPVAERVDGAQDEAPSSLPHHPV